MRGEGGTDGDRGRTAVDDDQLRDLRLTHISTRGELDAAEQANISAGHLWATRRPRTMHEILDDRFLRRLHREMFGDVWRWAGRYRVSATNIGVEHFQIAEAVRNLIEDAKLWCDSARDDSVRDRVCVEFHHRLVAIHPFTNGNGRHARMAADLLVAALGRPGFTWGGATGSAPIAGEDDPVRADYLSALREADAGDLTAIVEFARS